jgi:hypothetical protein
MGSRRYGSFGVFCTLELIPGLEPIPPIVSVLKRWFLSIETISLTRPKSWIAYASRNIALLFLMGSRTLTIGVPDPSNNKIFQRHLSAVDDLFIGNSRAKYKTCNKNLIHTSVLNKDLFFR